MSGALSTRGIEVIAPNFKRRLSGVTSTVVRLVPIQAQEIAIAAAGPALPDFVPQVRLRDLPAMSRNGPSGGPRVWHARRNVEMIGGLVLRGLFAKNLRLLFTSASQRRHSWLTRALIRRMDAVIATSARTAGYLEREATVILHGIDATSFVPPADRAGLRRDLGLPEGRIVGCFGRIRPSKGTDLFVEAMIRLLPDRPELTAVVMGRTLPRFAAFTAGIEARIAAAGLRGRIRLLPEVPVWDMPRWYQALDLFVAPQRWEGFGLTPLEAMACGVPVVATRVGAFPELVAEGETGLLVPAGDPAALADAAAGLLDDPARRAAMSRAARARVERQFRIETEARAIIAVYRRLLSDG